jgi:trehalose-6-phosphatase
MDLDSSGKARRHARVLGDDVTYEDAFSALPAGITVRVGRAGETSAKYHLGYQEAVLEFLTWLAELDDSPLQ